MKQGDFIFVCHHQRQAHLSEIVSFLFVLPASGDGATFVIRSNKGKEIGGVIEKGVRVKAVAHARLLEDLRLDCLNRLKGNCVHQVPEMLAVHLAQCRAQHILTGGGFGPGPPPALTCGHAYPSHGTQQQRGACGQVVAQRLGREVLAIGTRVLIDALYDVEFTGDAQQRRNGAVGV